MSLKVKILGLIAFLVVDAVLFYFIRERNLSHLADDPKTPAPTTASATPAPTFGGPVTMTASHNGAVFLVHRGSCAKKERPLVQVSSGGGARFRELSLPTTQYGSYHVTEVLAISQTSKTTLSMIALSGKCHQVAVNTTDGGNTWKSADVSLQWWISQDGKSVVTGAGDTSPGCTPQSVTGFDSLRGKVLCSDGSVLGTLDGGTSWVSLGSVTGTRSMTFASVDVGVAVGASDDCKSAVYHSYDGGRSWAADGCISNSAEVTSIVSPGNDKVLGTDGKSMWTSSDAGATWNEAGPIS